MIHVTCANIKYNEKISLEKNADGIIGIKVEGHALRKKTGLFKRITAEKNYGNILCASVSVLTLGLFKSIFFICDYKPAYKQEDGFFELIVQLSDLNKKQFEVIEVLIESFLISILDLIEKYPEEITLTMTDGTS